MINRDWLLIFGGQSIFGNRNLLYWVTNRFRCQYVSGQSGNRFRLMGEKCDAYNDGCYQCRKNGHNTPVSPSMTDIMQDFFYRLIAG